MKVIGGIGVCLLYNYIYKGGDTNTYYNDARIINIFFWERPLDVIPVLSPFTFSVPDHLLAYIRFSENFNAEDSFIIVKLTSIMLFFCFRSMLVASMLYGAISFIATWLIFKLFIEFMPMMRRQLAIVFLFVPSVAFWGSGILKDTVALSSLYVFFYTVVRIFIQNRYKWQYFLAMAISLFFISKIKVYIMVAFLPSLMLYVVLVKTKKVKNKIFKYIMFPFLLILGLGLAVIILSYMTKKTKMGLYSFENIYNTSKATHEYLSRLNKEIAVGSKYSLGRNIDFDNYFSVMTIIPAAINVTLFRPYLWESKNFIMFISALESFFIFAFTLYTLAEVKVIYFFKYIFLKPMISSFFLYSLIFAFSVGFVSGNFGTLVRYKIPCIPFYLLCLVLAKAYYKYEKGERQLN
ncbi:MAG: hypothetical protein NZ529_04980 [Cytophagaceae bacterium]|nr:hypothetical protein [Cytophagaceae bacterium]MDW8456129.1 hypothetical protein [Cytophagaceae bacterium]